MLSLLWVSILAILTAAPVAAQAPAAPQLTSDQKAYIVYDRCVMHEAIVASHTDAKDEDIFGIAKDRCATTRALVVAGQEDNHQLLAALDAADAEKAANFPAWIKGVRERRKAFEASLATPTTAPR